MADPSPFRQQLADAVASKHSRLNPFTERWVKGELTRDQLGAWAAQHYQYVSQFPRWCAAVYAECPDAEARDFLLENIVEEESGIKHVDLLVRFAEACGVSRARVEGARQLPTTRALTAWCYETSHRPFLEAAAGLLVGLESQVPGIYAALSEYQFVFGQGAVPLVDNGQVVGAVGVSGAVPADNDHAIADAAAGHPAVPRSH